MFANDTVSGRLERVKGIKPQRLEGKVRACAGLHLGAGWFGLCGCCA